MNRAKAWGLLLGILVLSCSACGTRTPTGEGPKTEGPVLTVLRFKGDVNLRKGPEGSWTRLSEASRLLAGDEIRSGKASWASFRLPGGGVAQISAESEMSVKALLPAEKNEAGILGCTLELLQGIGLFQANGKSLRVVTRNAVTGVIGTMFGLETDEKQTRLVVKKHKVSIASATTPQNASSTAPPKGPAVRTVPEAHESRVIGTNEPSEPEAVNLIMPGPDDRLAQELLAFEGYVNTAIRGMTQEGVTEKSLDRSIDVKGESK